MKYTSISEKCTINSMEHSLSWEVHSHSASQESPHFFMPYKGSLLCSHELTTSPCLQPDESNLHLPTTFPAAYAKAFSVACFLQAFQQKCSSISLLSTYPAHHIHFSFIIIIFSDRCVEPNEA